jgi:predicted AAA+ superfamily ATPase
MESLKQKFFEKYALTQVKTVRDFVHTIDWNDRFIGIKGSRGVGKTTLVLQHIKQNFKPDNKVLYISLDNIYFSVPSNLTASFFKSVFQLTPSNLLVNIL